MKKNQTKPKQKKSFHLDEKNLPQSPLRKAWNSTATGVCFLSNFCSTNKFYAFCCSSDTSKEKKNNNNNFVKTGVFFSHLLGKKIIIITSWIETAAVGKESRPGTPSPLGSQLGSLRTRPSGNSHRRAASRKQNRRGQTRSPRLCLTRRQMRGKILSLLETFQPEEQDHGTPPRGRGC